MKNDIRNTYKRPMDKGGRGRIELWELGVGKAGESNRGKLGITVTEQLKTK